MKVNIKLCTIFLLLSYSHLDGQINAYDYNCELIGISDDWHKIVLPNEIFGKLNSDLSDIRVYGVTPNNDTIEAPYIIKQTKDKVISKDVAFKRLNTSSNDEGYYFTLEIPTTEVINQINLDFEQVNFDWRVKLEASNDQQEWFIVSDDYRILSIKNDNTDYHFTKLNFPDTKFRYFRLLIKSDEKPQLSKVSVIQKLIEKGKYRNYSSIITDKRENKKANQTEIDIEMPLRVPVSELSFEIADDYDYYRPLRIQFVNDSTQTEKGWIYNYRTLKTGVINSIDDNDFNFDTKILRKLRIIVQNHDNESLNFEAIKLRGCVHECITRFTVPARYLLTYGNKTARKPKYDIDRFMDKIPIALRALELDTEHQVKKDNASSVEPLFKNKLWLWGIMGLLILVLAWFSLRMIKNMDEKTENIDS